MTHSDPLELWFEFASTYSYLAIERAPLLSVPVRYQPFLLGPIFAAQGWRDSPFNLYPAKGQYMWRDLARLCEEAGIPLRKPSRFPRSGLHAARIAIANRQAAFLPAFLRSVFRANFAEDREIGEPSVLAEILDALSLDAAGLMEHAGSPAVKQALREQNERAVALSLFGAPTYVVGSELFWGNDRLEQALRWHAQGRDR
jgi:2-hydroxychromene-2-carboxylate isomerase